MNHDNRWYDHEPKTATAINMLLLFPKEVQRVLGNGVCSLAEGEFEVNSLLENLRSLGSEKVLALYKSKEKRRKYDQLPGMHASVNYLYLMPPQNRGLLVDKVRELTNNVAQYLQMCKTTTHEAAVREIDELTKTYVKNGMQSAQNLIRRIEESELESMEPHTADYADTEVMRVNFQDVDSDN